MLGCGDAARFPNPPNIELFSIGGLVPALNVFAADKLFVSRAVDPKRPPGATPPKRPLEVVDVPESLEGNRLDLNGSREPRFRLLDNPSGLRVS